MAVIFSLNPGGHVKGELGHNQTMDKWKSDRNVWDGRWRSRRLCIQPTGRNGKIGGSGKPCTFGPNGIYLYVFHRKCEKCIACPPQKTLCT